MVENKDNKFDQIADHVVQIQLTDQNSFCRIAEVLTRIGIPSYKNRTLYQTAHILHKKQKYYIVHFKDMFVLDGKNSTIDDNDIDRVYCIARLLQKWGLCKIVNDDANRDTMIHNSSILVIPRTAVNEWKLVSKYTIGNKHNKQQ